MRIDFDTFAERFGIAGPLIVVAPHADDETLGCGGLIALALAAGHDVAVLVVTDGAASHPGSRVWPPDRVAEQRRAEVTEALCRLGMQGRPLFLNLPDAGTQELPEQAVAEARRRLTEMIIEQRAGTVFTTWRREPHCDHQFTYTLARDALREAASAAVLLEYMVWTPITGAPEALPQPGEATRIELDISPVRATKFAALQAHRSQLGLLIKDDPTGFVLTTERVAALTGPYEYYICGHKIEPVG